MQNSLLQSPLNTHNINKVILLVEDSDEDFAAFSRMLCEAAFLNPVYRACDGDDALDYTLPPRGVR